MKQTFASDFFASDTFAAGHWTGEGESPVYNADKYHRVIEGTTKEWVQLEGTSKEYINISGE